MKLSKFSLLGAFMLLAGCSDDLDFHPAKTGENIQFGTKAYFANADTKSSRTEYGDVSADKKAIELKWVKGDKILIACPQVSQPVSGAVEYQVNEQHAITDGTYNEKDEATSLSPTSMPGLQWGDVTKAHNFYGIYPSANAVNQFALDEVADGKHTTFTGVLPQSQDPKEIVETTNGYVAKPNMDYAYMVAQTTNKVGPEGVVSKDVVLTFEPIVTALQFDIIAKKVANESPDVTINSINLYSQTKNISGEFTCDFGTKSVTVSGEKGAKNVNMFFKDGVKLTADQHLNFTFFFLSNRAEALTENDMKVTFNYTANNVVKTKTATIGREISAKVKYYFKGIKFNIEGESAEGSNWFSHVEDVAYINQLSIPVAGNPFSDQSETNKQQEKDYVSLWKLGVRGFELPTDRAKTAGASLDSMKFVVGESEVGTLTLGTALGKLKELQSLKGSEKEPLILVFRYYPVNVGYNPREYLKQVIQTLKKAALFDKLVKVDNQSTASDLKGKVVAFVRLGDDAYIRMARIEGQFTNFTSCNDLADGIDMGNIMFIKDWGNAYDCWDRRYPNVERQSNWTETYSSSFPNGASYTDYKIQKHAAGHIYKGSGVANAVTYQLKKDGISCIEDLLCGVSSSSEPYNSVNGYLDFGDEPVRLNDHSLMFKHDIHGGGTAYVQEWSRVIYDNMSATSTGVRSIGQNSIGASTYGNHYLFAKWWKSIDQKKSQIDALFADAITNTAASIFINVLSGYYAVATEKTSMIPCKRWIATPETYWYAFQTMNYALVPSGQGKGGDFSALARDLNTYVYNKLRTDAYGIGPWGFIQLDYIGATSFSTNYLNEYSIADAVNASANIVPLIVANNFRFIKNTKRETVNAPVVSNGPADMTIGMQ